LRSTEEVIGMFGRARDPVCGVKVKKSTVYKSFWNGRWYYFDSAACKATFEENRERYVGGSKGKGFLNRLAEAGDQVPKSCHEIQK